MTRQSFCSDRRWSSSAGPINAAPPDVVRPEGFRRRAAGYTAIELLVVVAIIGIILLIGYSSLLGLFLRGPIEGFSRSTKSRMLQARSAAIRRSVPVVVTADYAEDVLFAFADVNDDAGNPISNLLYDPLGTPGDRATDYPVFRVELPAGVAFWGPADAAAEGPDAIHGFTAVTTVPDRAAVFEANGSIRDRGAFVLSDGKGNFLQLLVSPEATAKITVRKYNPDISLNPLDGSEYHPFGKDQDGNPTWVWYR